MIPTKVESILKEIQVNISNKKYLPLDHEKSLIIRDYFKFTCPFDINGNGSIDLYTKSGTHIATGYKRVVIGDYGAYIEFDPDQIIHRNIENKFRGEPKRPVKYIWKVSKDAARIKIYEQKATVSYADYKPKMFYISPFDLIAKKAIP
jgi:hypothetical protein